MTSDPDKPAPPRWWKRPAFLLGAPVMGLLTWISTCTGVIDTVRKSTPPPPREAGSLDIISVTNLPPVTAPVVSPGPPAEVGRDIQTPMAEPRMATAAPPPVPREQSPAISGAAKGSGIRMSAGQVPEPGDEWFDEAEGAALDQRPVMHRLAATMGFQRMCVPRIVAHYGVAGGIVSNALTRPGNPNCVQATYGDMMSLVVEPCGGELTEISQIEVERGAFLEDGRPRTYAASLSYSLIANGQETLPLPLGTGGYRKLQSVQFTPVRASAVRVTVRSPRTTGYKIYQRICSIVVR